MHVPEAETHEELSADEVARLVGPLRGWGDDAAVEPALAPAIERRRRRRMWRRTTALVAVFGVVGALAVTSIGDDGGTQQVATRPKTATGPSAAPSSAPPATTPTSAVSPAQESPLAGAPVDGDQYRAVQHAYAGASEETQAACPALAPTDLGTGAGATPRVSERSDDRMWWATWDLAGAAGESDIQMPCEHCGRETIFVSGQPEFDPAGAAAAIDAWDLHMDWADGSRAGYGPSGRGDDEGVPVWNPGGRVELWSPEANGWIAYLEVAAAPGCFYQVGSHISQEHLVGLLASLRPVAPG